MFPKRLNNSPNSSAIFCISVHIGLDFVDVYGYQMKCGMFVGVVC